VNGGLARSERGRVKPSRARRAKGTSNAGLTAQAGEDRQKAQDGERSSFSGSPIVKSGVWIVGPGL
jgi:hypothetical protein